MERTKKNNKRPTALLCGDWHIREDIPKCRTDDFWEAQWKKVAFISALQKQYDCPVLHSGDVFEHWKPSPYLLAKTIRRFPDQFWTVYGNHDLPAHSLAQSEKSGIEVLMAAEKIQILDGSHWEQTPKNGSLSFLMGPHYNVLVWHVMTYQGKPPWPGCTDLTAIEILEKYPQFDLIVTGHNHKTFVEEMDGRLLVNPGSLTRQTADQVKHKPCVFLWYAQTNTIKQVFLPYEKGVN